MDNEIIFLFLLSLTPGLVYSDAAKRALESIYDADQQRQNSHILFECHAAFRRLESPRVAGRVLV
jgi:hypothetical protein